MRARLLLASGLFAAVAFVGAGGSAHAQESEDDATTAQEEGGEEGSPGEGGGLHARYSHPFRQSAAHPPRVIQGRDQ